jgi:polysaccharide biosynthesis/export protein
MFARVSNLCALTVLVLLAALGQGCISYIPSPFRPSPGPQASPLPQDLAQAFEIVCRNYRIGPQDVLRIIYQTEWNIPAGSYKLDTLDEVDIEFIVDSTLNRKVVIRPDGMITLPGVGDIAAAGMTPDQLGKRVEQEYLTREILTKKEERAAPKKYRMVTVSVSNFFQKVDRLVKALTTLTTGQQTQINVNPDGTIDLPLLEDRVLAAGHTVTEVERTVNRLYRSGPLKNVVASLSLFEARSRKVYILGEVSKPGGYDINQPITALHAIALAGGELTETADLTSVMLISKDIHGRPIGRRLDLKKALDAGDMASAILVKPYDVIYVPKTYIRDVRIFMDQYIGTVSQMIQFVNLIRP